MREEIQSMFTKTEQKVDEKISTAIGDMKDQLTKNFQSTAGKLDSKIELLQTQMAVVRAEVISTVKEELSTGLENARDDTLVFMQKNCDMFMDAVNQRLDNYTLLNLKAARPKHLPTDSPDEESSTREEDDVSSDVQVNDRDECEEATSHEETDKFPREETVDKSDTVQEMNTEEEEKKDLPQDHTRKRRAPDSIDTDASVDTTPNPSPESKDSMDPEEVRKAEEIATRIIASETAPAKSMLISQGSEESNESDETSTPDELTSSSSEEDEETEEDTPEAEEQAEDEDEVEVGSDDEDNEKAVTETAKPYNLCSRGSVALARRL